MQQSRVDEVTLANWLKPSSDDDDFFETWVTRNPEDVEIPWQQCLEVIMDYSPALGNAITFKICSELKDLAKWMTDWDKMVAEKDEKQMRERGQKGQCRYSNHSHVCHAWDPTVTNSRTRIRDVGRRDAARFYCSALDWASQKGKDLSFWRSNDETRPTIVLRAIRAIWKKEKCHMEMLYEIEKNIATTHYIPISLITYMRSQFPILMWAEIFQTSPKFAHLYAPTEVVLAIELFLQGEPSPWKKARNVAIENEKQRLALTDGNEQPKKAKKASRHDHQKSRPQSSSAWSETDEQQSWHDSGTAWAGWTSYPSAKAKSEWWERHEASASSRDIISDLSEDQSQCAGGPPDDDHSEGWKVSRFWDAPWKKIKQINWGKRDIKRKIKDATKGI